jgi:hypothetical protein
MKMTNQCKILGTVLAMIALTLCSTAAFGVNKVSTLEFVSVVPSIGKYKGSIAYANARFDNGCYQFLVRRQDLGHLYLINPETKAYMKLPFHKATPVHDRFSNIKYINMEVIEGIKCSHYFCSGNIGDIQADYWATKEIKTLPEIADACCRYCGTPTGYGLPVRMLEKSQNRYEVFHFKKRLDTLKIQKCERDEVFFEVPKTYKLVTDQITLFSSDNGKLDADGVFFHSSAQDDMLMFGTKGLKR